MSNDKGKGKVPPAESREEDNSLPCSESPSLISRVAASASGLTRDVLGRPNSNEIRDHAAFALANSGKGQSLRQGGGSSAWAESSKLSKQSGTSFIGGSARLRADDNAEHVRRSENEFLDFLDGVDSFVPSEELLSKDHTAGATENTYEKAWPLGHSHQSGTIAEPQLQDGHEVLQLLNIPSAEEFSVAPPEDDENYDWDLTPDQISKLREMTKDILPPPEEHSITSIPTEHPLNLIPMSDSQLLTSPDWREQWESVLNRYTDEVWGGLLPIVKEARVEVKELPKYGSDLQQPKALRRLEAILWQFQRR